MNKKAAQTIADKIFKADKKIKTAYVTSDGFGFVSENSADLHKNTNKSGKDVTIYTFDNPGTTEDSKKGATKDVSNDVITFPIKEKDVKALKLTDLQKIAEDLKIDLKDLDTKAKIAEAINKLKTNS